VTFKLGKGLTVTGRAVDSSGKPVAGAKVLMLNGFVSSGRQGLTTTDGDGTFTLSGLDAQSKRELLVMHEQRKLTATFAVKAAKDQKHVDGVEVKVEPFAGITGRVLDEEKKPITGATVHAYVMVQQEQAGQTFITSFSPFAERAIKTDQEGKF